MKWAADKMCSTLNELLFTSESMTNGFVFSQQQQQKKHKHRTPNTKHTNTSHFSNSSGHQKLGGDEIKKKQQQRCDSKVKWEKS